MDQNNTKVLRVVYNNVKPSGVYKVLNQLFLCDRH